MNIFHKIALQGLIKNRTRTVVTIIGVILSAALITGVVTFGISLLAYMTKGAEAKYGTWHVAFSDVDSSFIEEQTRDERVSGAAAFENVGYAVLEGGENPDKPYVFLAGFEEETYDTLPVRLLTGRLPENSSEILVPAHVITNGGVEVSVGDSLTLSVGTRRSAEGLLSQHDAYTYEEEYISGAEEKTYTVVGLCTRPYFEEITAPGYTLITKADQTDPAGSFSIFITLKNPYQLKEYIKAAADKDGYILNDDVLRFMGLSRDRLFTTLLFSIAVIVIAIIMTGSVFLIYNSFNISLNERTRQFGILMSVGATARQLRNSVLFEGICIGAVGIPAGILAGLGSMKMVISVVAENFGNIMYSDVSLNLRISPPAIVGAAVISLITILISAYLPARKAVNTSVMECIRQTNEVKLEAKAVKISGFAEHIYGLEGTLALKNFKRNRGRCRSIVLSLVLSVVLFIVTNSFVIDLKQASGQAYVYTTYDIGISMEDMDDGQMQALYEKLKAAGGVTKSSYLLFASYSCTVRAGDLAEPFWQGETPPPSDEPVKLTMGITFLDDSSYLELLRSANLPETEYTGQEAKLPACAVMAIDDGRSHELEDFQGMFAGSSLDMTIKAETAGETDEAPVYAVSMNFVNMEIPDCLPLLTAQTEAVPYYFQAVAPYSQKDRFVTENMVIGSKGMTFNSDTPTQTAAKLEKLLQGEGILTGYTLYNMGEILEESRNMIFIANVFAYTFIIIISLIAIANVFNTITTNIRLRRRELAMLRSVGMSDRDFNKMMRFECAFYGGQALLFGLPLALLASWLIYKGMLAGGSDGISFVFPWASMGISICSVLLVIFVTMMYSVSKIKKENIIDALRDEMT